jgi:hypothetical protein
MWLGRYEEEDTLSHEEEDTFLLEFPIESVKPVRSIARKKHFCSTFEHQFHALVNLPSIQDPVI